ncbi:MAG: hypothetical protein KAR11_04295 [Phycisphaerae bacterium]|nr:hypothetical protein [Phycisphaerae bacterium]
MTVKGITGYVLVVLTGLYMVAAITLVLLNIKNTASIWFGQNLDGSSTGWVMIFSALVGFSFYWGIKWMFLGIKDIRAGAMRDKVNRVGKLDKIAKSKPAAAPSPTEEKPQ